MIRYEDTRLTKLFVGGIPYETDNDSLEEFFKKFGEIKEAVVIRNRDTQKSKGYGFVTFFDKDCAEKACEEKRPTIDGRRANVNYAYIGAKQKPNKGNAKNPPPSTGFGYKQGTILGSHQFVSSFPSGAFTQLPPQQLQAVPLVSPVPQSPNGQVQPSPPTLQPVQLIEYNGVPTIVFGTVYDQVYYSPSPSYVPSPTLPAVATSMGQTAFPYQAVPPQTPPLNASPVYSQHFFPAHMELISQLPP